MYEQDFTIIKGETFFKEISVEKDTPYKTITVLFPSEY